jgi:hypothetical protein
MMGPVEGTTAVLEVAPERGPAPPDPHPPRRSRLRAQRRARTARALLALLVVAAAVAAVVVSRTGLSEAEDRGASVAAEADGAASARRQVEDTEAATLVRQAQAEDLAALAEEAREAQRQRLRDLGLTEFTVDAFVDRVGGNTELVEWQRDETTAEVDRQAQQIPYLERCMVAARQAINSAFNRSIDPNVVVPTPTEVCLALLVPEP